VSNSLPERPDLDQLRRQAKSCARESRATTSWQSSGLSVITGVMKVP
jgi:hypothetical protein